MTDKPVALAIKLNLDEVRLLQAALSTCPAYRPEEAQRLYNRLLTLRRDIGNEERGRRRPLKQVLAAERK